MTNDFFKKDTYSCCFSINEVIKAACIIIKQLEFFLIVLDEVSHVTPQDVSTSQKHFVSATPKQMCK